MEGWHFRASTMALFEPEGRAKRERMKGESAVRLFILWLGVGPYAQIILLFWQEFITGKMHGYDPA